MSILIILAAALTGGIAGFLAVRRYGCPMSGRGEDDQDGHGDFRPGWGGSSGELHGIIFKIRP